MLYQLLLLSNIVSTIAISVIAPFFPPIAEEKGVSIQMIGLILAANPLGAFVASIMLAKSLTKQNRCFILLIGLLVESMGLLLFLLVEWIENLPLLLTVTISARLLQGFGTAAFAVPIYGLIPVLFPKDVERRISIMEISSSIGYIAGPLLGGILYQIGGYKAPFLCFSIIIIVSAPIIYKLLSKQLKVHYSHSKLTATEQTEFLNGSREAIQPGGSPEIDESVRTTINFIEIFANLSISLTFFVNIVSTFSYMYFEPIQATFLIETYQMDMNHVGYIMTICTISYIVGTIVIGCIKVPKKLCLFLGVLICSVTFFFQGPDKNITQLDKSLNAVVLAQTILGFSCAMIFIPSLPLLNEIILTMYPNQHEKAGNVASILFNCSISCGEFIGPLVGGIMTEYFGYIDGCSYTGFIVFAIAISYALVLLKSQRKMHTETLIKVPILTADSHNIMISNHLSPQIACSISPSKDCYQFGTL